MAARVALHWLDRRAAHPHPRRLLLAVMILIVLLGHAWVGREWSLVLQDWKGAASPIEVVDLTVTGALKPKEPVQRPRPAPPPPEETPPPLEDAAAPPDAAASDAQRLAAGAQASSASVSQAAPDSPQASAGQPAAADPQPASTPGPALDPWPPSTRIRYSLKGNYRGDFSGQAQVLWLRDGERYRVELEVSIGPRAAPIMSRRVVSEGRLGANGLTPRRYEEDTRVLFARSRRVSLGFEPGAPGQPGSLVLPDGKRRPAPAGTQDSASQFVQLAWLFGTHPTPVAPGDRVSFPLALARRSDQWTYVVGDPVTVETSAGPVQTIHARPQRELDPLRRELIAEVWFAPALQYLPVRMQVVVDADTYALMVMDGLPELVGPVSLAPSVQPATPNAPAVPAPQ